MLRVRQVGDENQEVTHRVPGCELTQPKCAIGIDACTFRQTQERHLVAGSEGDLLRRQQAACAGCSLVDRAHRSPLIWRYHSGWCRRAHASLTVPRVMARTEPLTQMAA